MFGGRSRCLGCTGQGPTGCSMTYPSNQPAQPPPQVLHLRNCGRGWSVCKQPTSQDRYQKTYIRWWFHKYNNGKVLVNILRRAHQLSGVYFSSDEGIPIIGPGQNGASS